MVAGTEQFCHFRTSTSTNIVVDRKVELHDVTDKQTCIEVKIVRSDKQMSQDPAIACAVRQ